MPMNVRIVPCGYLKVQAVEMIKPWTEGEIRSIYENHRFLKYSCYYSGYSIRNISSASSPSFS